METKIVIPFPTVRLRSLNEKDLTILDYLPENVCPGSIKVELVKHITYHNKSNRIKFSKEPKEFYIVPFGRYFESVKDFGLRCAEHSALWLPSVALNIAHIRKNVPQNLMESPIVAFDWDFSYFTNQSFMLAVDLSFGKAQFLFWEREGPQMMDPDYQFLAEIDTTK